MKLRKESGFTLIELLVVIAIIGILASTVLSSLNDSRKAARDAIRKSDLNTIATALVNYHNKTGGPMHTGSGCGHGGNGNGWFGFYNTSSYVTPSLQCLLDTGSLSTPIVDPSGATAVGNMAVTGRVNENRPYMQYSCIQSGKTVTYIYAALETLPYSTTATDGTCCSSCDLNYGMNYYKVIN